MNPTNVLIMAAGKGTRLKSSLPKVLHLLAGQSLIEHVLNTVEALNPHQTLVIVGHQAELVRSKLGHFPVHFAEQVPQLGTGHAVQIAREWWSGKSGNLLILSGDAPLISLETLQKMIQAHNRTGASLTLLSARLSDPFGYGRVIRAADGQVRHVVEQKDASPSEQEVNEVNTGFYCFRISALSGVIDQLTPNNRQNEYYLTDCVGLLSRQGKPVEAVICEDSSEVMGINSRVELARMEKMLRERRVRQLMADGVTVIDPHSAYIDIGVTVGPDTILYPNVHLQKGTVVGSECQIHSNCRLSQTIVGDRVVILDSCLITDSRLPAGTRVEPFTHLRNQVEGARHRLTGAAKACSSQPIVFESFFQADRSK